MPDGRRWTIYACPGCDYVTPYESHAEEHAATFCDPDLWPWEPVEVVPASEVDRLTDALDTMHEFGDELAGA